MRMDKIPERWLFNSFAWTCFVSVFFTASTCSSFYISWSTWKGLISDHHPNCTAGQCNFVCNDNCATFISYLAWSSLGDLVSGALIYHYILESSDVIQDARSCRICIICYMNAWIEIVSCRYEKCKSLKQVPIVVKNGGIQNIFKCHGFSYSFTIAG
jgi:hypothetical protein